MDDEPAGKGLRYALAATIGGALRNELRLVLISALLVIAAIWLSVGLYVSEQRRSLYQAAEQELRGGILTLSSHARRTLEAVNTTLRSVDSWLFEASKSTRLAPLAELDKVIADIQALNEDFIDIRPISNDGYLFRFAAGDDFRTYVGDRPYFDALYLAKPGTLYLSEPVVSRDSGRFVLPVAMKVRPNRFGIGYLVAAVTIDQFDAAYRDLLISATGRIGLVRSDGRLLVSVPEDLLKDTSAGTDFLNELAEKSDTSAGTFEATSPLGGSGTVVAAMRLARQPILVYAAFERDELDQRWRAGAWPAVLAGIAATLLTVVIAGWLRHLVRLREREAANTVAALEAANAANAAKRKFLANMSHELRTPLNAILGFSEVISRAMFGPLDLHYQTYGNDIHKSGKHLLHLVDQLLDISRIESGTIALRQQPCDLDEILKEALRIVEPLRARRNLSVSCDLARSTGPVMVDRGILRQILINLLGNAAKYNKDGGSIAIGAWRDAGAVVIEIADTGQGIAAEDLCEIFEPFKKGDALVAQQADAGLGLGLPIVKALMELINGEIQIDSTVGQGTRVRLHLPDDVAVNRQAS